MGDLGQVGKDLVESMGHADLAELTTEYLQAGLEAAAKNDAVAHLPIVGTVLALAKFGVAFRDRLLIEKVAAFLGPLGDVSQATRLKMIGDLEADAAYGRRVGSHLVEILDRLDSHRKPSMLGLVFKAYAKGEIDVMMLQRLVDSIERLPTFEVDRVRPWSNAKPGSEILKIDRESMQAYASSGLTIPEWLTSGMAYFPNKVCQAFLRLNLDVESRTR